MFHIYYSLLQFHSLAIDSAGEQNLTALCKKIWEWLNGSQSGQILENHGKLESDQEIIEK